MIYGYARVSTDPRDLGNQVAELKAAGCATIFREKISGATAEWPWHRTLMATVITGDVGVIPPLTGSRATRPTCWRPPATCGAPELACVRSRSLWSIPRPIPFRKLRREKDSPPHGHMKRLGAITHD